MFAETLYAERCYYGSLPDIGIGGSVLLTSNQAKTQDGGNGRVSAQPGDSFSTDRYFFLAPRYRALLARDKSAG